VALQRLVHKRDFESVLSQRPSRWTPHFALHVLQPVAKPFGVGVVLPKRWAKRAVTRNGIRRQIYAVAAQALRARPGRAMVVRQRAAFSQDDFPSAWSRPLKRQVRNELQQLLSGCAA
jgi:ribonuclease P protein component